MKIKLPYVAVESEKEAEFRQYTEGKVSVELTKSIHAFHENNKFEDMVRFCLVNFLVFL